MLTEDVEFDRQKFQNAKIVKLHEEVIRHKEIVEFLVFDYKSLEEDELDLFMDFIRVGIYKFYGYSYDYYPEMIREFYVNKWIKEVEFEEHMDRYMKSYLNGVEMMFDEELLKKLFHLNNEGRKCSDQEFTRDTLDGPAYILSINAMVDDLLRKFKVLILEIRKRF